MAKLLASTQFDHFLLRELDIQTFTNFHIDGKLNSSFFSSEELEEREDQQNLFWSEIRAIAFSVIKGNKTPLAFKVVFQAPQKQVEELTGQLAGRIEPEQVGGLYFNIRFEKNELHIVTGTAIKTFTLDKTLEHEWDHKVKEFLAQEGIIVEEE